jgi:hypothetical protein
MNPSSRDANVPQVHCIPHAPVARPKPVAAQLEAALRKTMSDRGIVKLLAEVGMEAVGSTSDELDVLTCQQFALYRGIVQGHKAPLGGQ